jgi:hypothetical protein
VSGGHGCRFVVLRRRKLAPLTRRFEAQELAVQHVRGTICWLFTQD